MIYKKFNTKLNLPLLLAVAFFITTISVFAQKPNTTPTPGQGNGSGALQSVTTDNTLTGNGTTAVPLGVANNGISTNKIADGAVNQSKVANGAITAPKFETQNAPQAGQVLTFNGTGLSWQPSKSSLRVVDSLGKDVGFYEAGGVIFYLSSLDKWFFAAAGKPGFFEGAPYIFWKTNDCTGSPYTFLSVDEDSFVEHAQIYNGLIYYAISPHEAIFNWSIRLDDGSCLAQSGFSGGSRFATTPISELGVTPPFRLSR